MAKFYFLLLTTCLCSLNSFGQQILNGDFEETMFGCQVNASNAAYNEAVAHSTAFGNHQGIDILYDTCGHGTPLSGFYFIYLALHHTDTAQRQAVSFELSDQLQAGRSYSLTLYGKRLSIFDTPDVEIGVSATNNAFGTFVGTASFLGIDSFWTERTLSFVAPLNADFITVTVCNDTARKGIALDNFFLNPETSVFDERASGSMFEMYPNPATETLRISYPSADIAVGQLRIFNASGVLLISENFIRNVHGHQIDISGLASGAYLMTLHSNTRRYAARKFIVQ